MKKAIYGNQRQAILLSYLAGIIDGEGTIRIGKVPAKNNRQAVYYVSIGLGMTDEKIVDLLVKVLGAKKRIECVPYNRKTIYRWGTCGNIAIPRIIKKILPYLRVKKRQAELALQFSEGYKKGIDSERICRKCREKKKIRGYGLCDKCYAYEMRHNNIEKWKKNYRKPQFVPIKEIQRREDLYQKIKKLNAVGAAAETKQEHTREGEAIVRTHAKA